MNSNKKAIIVNGITDMNKGDQALVWESVRIIQDTGAYNDIKVISLGDTPEEREALCGQTEARGIYVIRNLLKHPRRGKHHKDKLQKEGFGYLFFQIKNAIFDFISLSFLKFIFKIEWLTKLIYSDKINETIRAFIEVDTVYVKGGGFIHAHGERTAPYAVWYMLFYMNLAKKLNKELVLLPNSYGPFEGATVKKQLISGLKHSNLILSREKVSSSKLSALLNTDIPTVPDLGFYLGMKSKEEGFAVLEKYNFNKQDKIIGITVRPWRFPGTKNPEELYTKYLKSIKQVIEHTNNLGYKVAVFNQSIGPNAHEDDRNAIEQLVELCDNENTKMFTWVNENLACDLLKAVYSNIYIFIGTRFHSLIFSMTSEVPSISIAYGGNKGVGIMKDFGLGEYVVKIDDVNEDILSNLFDKACLNFSLIKAKLSDKLPYLESQRIETINLIKQSIN